MQPWEKILRLVHEICRRLDEDLSLDALATRVGWSKFYLQRVFTSFTGETPKQYTQRLRLERAAAVLITSSKSVLEIALASGFASHEVFVRAFRRHLDCSPTQYRRATIMIGSEHARMRHRETVMAVGPCLRLYHASLNSDRRIPTMPTSTVERKELEEQPILFIRRRIPFTQLQSSMGECFGTLYGYGQKEGLAIAGQPIARYVSTGAGLWTIDFAMPLLAPASGEGEMQAGVLPAGPVAFAVHMGEYDQLAETNAAIEQWIEDNRLRGNGPPWESYVTSPAEVPNPAHWRTEVFWPLAD